MSQRDNTWTIRFPNIPGTDGPPEFIPETMHFKRKRLELSFCRMSFSPEVGEALKPHTRYEGGRLSEPTIADVCYNGEPVMSLYFEPDFADYRTDATHLEFHDAQKILEDGVADIQGTGTIRNAYERVWSSRKDRGILNELRFSVPDAGPGYFTGGETPAEWHTRDYDGERTQAIIETKKKVNIERENPFTAMWNLNEQFGFVSWVTPNLDLWVGIPEAFGYTHIAAPDDTRVWRYDADEMNITHPRKPVKQVTINGAWVDESGIGGATDWADFFTTNKGLGDVRAQGVAYRTDITGGETLSIDRPDLKREALPLQAELKLHERMKRAYAGSVQIDTAVSGDHTPLHQTRPGDILHLVPDDKFFDNPAFDSGQIGDTPEEARRCNGFVNNERYIITEVQHDIGDDGHWSMTLNVTLYPDTPGIKRKLRFFDPRSEEFLTTDQVFDGAWFEEGEGWENLKPMYSGE